MARPLLNSSPNNWIASQNGSLKAFIDISPDVSFPTLVGIVADFFGLSLSPTERFDECPAVSGEIANHEVIVFDLPDEDLIPLRGVPKYQLTIYPEYPEGHELEYSAPRDLSTELIQLLTPLLPSCQLQTDPQANQ